MSNVWPGEAGVRESTSNERRPRGADGLADWPGSASPRVDAGKPGSLKTVGRYRGNGATTTPRVPSETVRWAATVTVWRPTRASLVAGMDPQDQRPAERGRPQARRTPVRPVGSQSAEGDCVQSTGAGEAIQRRSASVNFTLLCELCGLGVSWARLVGPGPGVGCCV